MPVITIAIIVVNVIAYLLAIRHGGSFFGGPTDQTAVRFGAIPYELTHPGDHCELITRTLPQATASTIVCQGQPGVSGTPASQPATWITVFTSMFLHGGFLHIASNMIYLWVFGDNVEDAFGHVGYLIFYLVCGLIAGLAQIAIDPTSRIPSIGASGAIAGVLGAYLVIFGSAQVRTLVFLGPIIFLPRIPAMFLIGFWFVTQLISGLGALTDRTQQTGGVAFWAHIGGFVAGVVLALLFRPRVAPASSYRGY